MACFFVKDFMILSKNRKKLLNMKIIENLRFSQYLKLFFFSQKASYLADLMNLNSPAISFTNL